jgi:MoaA/NifB/PqqE/SkfB family radical SAM enzyme
MDYALGEHAHWFLTDKCNKSCAPCFREFFQGSSTENLVKIAEMLATSDVKRVTIGGGEPTLVKSLDDILQIFTKAGIHVDLHTNGSTLSHERLEQLRGLVDTLGLPIDSLDDKIQTKIRAPGHLKQIKQVTEDAQALDYNLEFHTVVTYLNIDGIPKLYSGFIKKTNSKCWNIYEFNFDLARQNTFQGNYTEKEKIKRLQNLDKLRGPINHETGLSDGLQAKFLLTEEKMKSLDDRMYFVDLQNSRAPYFFINGSGDVEFYTWYSQKRKKIGNLLKDGFRKTVKKLRRADKQGPMFDENDFIEATNDLPIFARLYEGNYCDEEIDAIMPEYHKQVRHLARLWEVKRYGQAMTV